MASGPPCSHLDASPVPTPTSPCLSPRTCPHVPLPASVPPVPMSLSPPHPSPHPSPYLSLPMSPPSCPPPCPCVPVSPSPCPRTLEDAETLSRPAQAGTEGDHGPGGCCHLSLTCCHHPSQPGGTQGQGGGTWGQDGTQGQEQQGQARGDRDTGDLSVSPSQFSPSIPQRPFSSSPVPSQCPQCLPVTPWSLSRSIPALSSGPPVPTPVSSPFPHPESLPVPSSPPVPLSAPPAHPPPVPPSVPCPSSSSQSPPSTWQPPGPVPPVPPQPPLPVPAAASPPAPGAGTSATTFPTWPQGLPCPHHVPTLAHLPGQVLGH